MGSARRVDRYSGLANYLTFMEIFFLVAIVFVFWTSEILLGKPVVQVEEKKSPSPADKLADALKDYLKDIDKGGK